MAIQTPPAPPLLRLLPHWRHGRCLGATSKRQRYLV